MHHYRYRLTVTFKSGRQWRLGVEAEAIAEAVARDVGKNAEDVANFCLSAEKTGKLVWLRKGADFLS